MGTDKYTILEKGTVDTGAIVIDAIANGAIGMWAPVIGVTDSSITNGLPRVTTTTTLNDPLAFGVAVDGWTAGGTGGNAVDAAGKTVRVCIFGRCKVQVLGSTGGAISIMSPLVSSGTAGIAQLMPNLPSSYNSTARNNIIGYAMQASSADNDYIVMLVTRSG